MKNEDIFILGDIKAEAERNVFSLHPAFSICFNPRISRAENFIYTRDASYNSQFNRLYFYEEDPNPIDIEEHIRFKWPNDVEEEDKRYVVSKVLSSKIKFMRM